MKHLIFGILESPTRFGVQGHAIDSITGEVITSHFCSSERFAKSDLGFTQPLFTHDPYDKTQSHSTVSFNEQVHNKYKELYPEGYTLQWIGHWENDPRTIALKELHHAKSFELKN